MPLPLILAGAAVVSGVAGLVKGNRARKDFKKAERINRWAQEAIDDAKSDLEQTRSKSGKSLKHLGEIKLHVIQSSLKPFIDNFSKIKKVDYKDSNVFDESFPNVQEAQLTELIETTSEFSEIAYGGVAALGTGGLVGLAAYGSVGTLATASTGTAIGTLTGAAATNATLAWLGGGSIAAGGLGVAGGTAVLGGIVAGPVLAVGGFMMANKAEAAVEDAKANEEQSELIVEEIKFAESKTKAIDMTVVELSSVIKELDEKFKLLLSGLENLVIQEGRKQSNLHSSLMEKLRAQLTLTEKTATQYSQSNDGLWNKIKYLFKPNPIKKELEENIKVLKSIANEQGFLELISLNLNSEKLDVFNSELSEALSKLSDDVNTIASVYSEQDLHYALLSDEDKKGLHKIIGAAQTIKHLVDTPLLSEEGELTGEVLSLVGQNKTLENEVVHAE